MTERFTAGELHAAGSRLGESSTVAGVLRNLQKSRHYSLQDIAEAGDAAGCGVIMATVIAEARRLRESGIYAGSDTLCVRELSAALKRLRLYTSLHEIMADVVSHREPEYPEGTVVRDNDGKGQWLRREGDLWVVFGRESRFTDEYPVKPLKVIS